MKLHVITIVSFFVILTACQQQTVEKNTTEPNREMEKMVQYNQYFLKQEAAAIKAYIKRHQWNMKRTDSGLWYEILQEGKGKFLHTGQEAKLKYRLELLDGSFCYDSDSTGLKQVVIEKSQIEAGLTEGLQLMSAGGKARFIMPAHLSYGVSGDGKCIPPRAAIVYHVEILSN